MSGAEGRSKATALLALLGVVCGLLLLVGLAVSLDRPARVAGNHQVNPEGLIDANNSPTLVRNPKRPDNLVVVHRIDRPRFNARLESSSDGGTTWIPTELPLPEGQDRAYAPDAAFGLDGTLYVTYLNLEGSGNTPANLWISRSSDGGRTLSAPVRVAEKLAFQPRLAVSPAGTVHLVWLQATQVALLSLERGPNPILTASSVDGGRTFSPPVDVSGPRPRVGAASVIVDGDAGVTVLFQDFGGDQRDFQNLEGPPWDETTALVLVRSEDGGRTFGPAVEVDDEVVLTRRFFPFAPEVPSLAAGPGGLYVAWADGRNGDLDVFLRRSDDRGRTWGQPVRVSRSRRGDGTSQYLPRVAVAPDGRVDVVFFDRGRDELNVLSDVTLSSSHDRGRTFRPVRVSTRSFDTRIGPTAGPRLEPDLGTRLGLLSDRRRTLAVWTDTRLGTADTGRQDIAFAAIVIDDDPLLTRRPVLAGIAAFGVLALAGAALTRRAAAAGGGADERQPDA